LLYKFTFYLLTYLLVAVHQLIYRQLQLCWQKSFYRRLTNEKQSDTFFRMFNDRIQDAQQSIKASVAANADESLANTENIDNKDSAKEEAKRKGAVAVIVNCLVFVFLCTLMFFICQNKCAAYIRRESLSFFYVICLTGRTFGL